MTCIHTVKAQTPYACFQKCLRLCKSKKHAHELCPMKCKSIFKTVQRVFFFFTFFKKAKRKSHNTEINVLPWITIFVVWFMHTILYRFFSNIKTTTKYSLHVLDMKEKNCRYLRQLQTMPSIDKYCKSYFYFGKSPKYTK